MSSPSVTTSRGRRLLVPLFVLAVVLTALALAERPTPSAYGGTAERTRADEVGVLTSRAPSAAVRRGAQREVGMRFSPKVAGTAIGVRYYKPRRSRASTPETATSCGAKGLPTFLSWTRLKE